ncbi:DNA ligase [Gemmata sp. G18]|uniref:DNA ligase n=1 Tax=Gemmata palustris TaxID=2822762 RepID=A0ABS5C062_9BACT|nr:DNA ligase [Gemmata palustris]MBP3959022.1 DNA ligase [Gemmata palustris]
MDLNDGQIYEMQGSGKNPYKIKNVGGVYSCSCPAWLNQNAPSNARTCKHIRKLRGDAVEEQRLASAGELLPPKPKGAEDKKELPLLQGEPWDEKQDLTGWWMSEKLDGVRAYWDGKQFLSRGYNIYYAPDWFTAGLPDHPLDGELWIARKKFQSATDIAKSQGAPDRWKDLKFLVFDAPDVPGPFEDRVKFLASAAPTWKTTYTSLVEHIACTGNDHVRAELERVTGLGGEGLMLRKPGSHYERVRSSTILKVKKFLDMEVVVTDYEPGEGRHAGRVGALWVRLSTGVKCKVGTGLKDKDRDNPPAKGSIITVKYQELTDDGALRFPVYVGPRPDGHPNAAPPTRKKETFVPVPEPAKIEKVTVAVAPPAPVAVPVTPPKSAEAPKPKSEPKPVPASPPISFGGSTMDTTTKRYFEFVDGSSSKFWEVWTEGTDVVTQWGKIGTPGRETRKEFTDAAKTQKEYDKLVTEKTGKGYSEKPRPA